METSVSLGVNPQLTVNRIQDIPSSGIAIVGTAPTAGLLGTFRQTFGPWLGYSANFGYSHVSEHFFDDAQDIGLDPHGESNVRTNMYEYSLTYVIHTRVNKRFSIFADAGLGGLTFQTLQKQYNLYPATQNLPTGVFGSGADLHLSSHFDLRAEYRGLFYKSPHLFSYPTPLTLTSEPTISLVYNFHPAQPWIPYPAPHHP
ncbi:MAG: outer membrane beta-barrel protein [Acidobacteriaceae bacterium]